MDRHFHRDREAGYGLLLLIGMVGVVLGLFMVAIGYGTRNKAEESRLAVRAHQLKAAGESTIRQLDQFARAGFLRADCANDALKPDKDAPAHVKARHAGTGFAFANCSPQLLRSKSADGVFAAAGSLPSGCNAFPTRVTVDEAKWEDRYVVVKATSAFKSGGSTPQTVKARLKLPPPPVPSFGLLVNDLHCGMCHVKVNGDVASTSPVSKFHRNPGSPWRADVNGTWYAHKTWNPTGGFPDILVSVAGGVRQNYSGTKLPGRFVPAGGGTAFKPEFPALDFAKIGPYVNPDPYSCATRKLDTKAQNTVLIGKSKASPIVLDGDLHVKGDLVITGWYRGTGTIYVDGNVYIPFDLRAVRSIFPYDPNPAVAEAQAKESLRSKLHDALAIATRKSIIIGEFDDNGQPNKSVWYHSLTPPDKRGDKIGVKDIYAWYPGGKAGYETLFKRAYNCTTKSFNGHKGSINLVEAYLYAQNTIGGLARLNSYSINGGIIADNYHVVSRSPSCPSDLHPVHMQPMNWSYVNYDHRMKFGLTLLDRFAEYFTPSN